MEGTGSYIGSLNKAQVIGNLGANAELKYTPGGTAVTRISVATNEVWKDAAGKSQERVTWHRIVIWGKVAEALAEYLTKGKQVYVEGRIEHNDWEDKQGVKRTTHEIRADRIVLLGSAGSNAGKSASQPTDAADAGAPIEDDDIPF